MKPLFLNWPKIDQRLHVARHRLLLFDFDGTLVPIQPRPEDVSLAAVTKRALIALAGAPDCTVGVVSGRSLRELRRRVAIPRLLYVGNHGFEIQRGKHRFVHPTARAKAGLLHQLCDEISTQLQTTRGAWVENKGYSLSVHFRQTPPNRIAEVRNVIQEIVRVRTVPGGLFLKEGKKVIEVRPARDWHKGSAVELLRKTEPTGTRVFYIGDDETDEDVFRSLSRADLTVHVGHAGPSAAQFSIANQRAMQKLLHKLLVSVRNRTAERAPR